MIGELLRQYAMQNGQQPQQQMPSQQPMQMPIGMGAMGMAQQGMQAPMLDRYGQSNNAGGIFRNALMNSGFRGGFYGRA